MYIVVTLVMAVICYAAFGYAATSPTKVPLLVAFGAVSAVLALVFLWAEDQQGIRRVLVSDGGVAFGYLLHTQFAPWSELSLSRVPQRDMAERGGIYILRSIVDKGKPGLWMHFVTRDQARAILSHTSCPIREIEPGVRAYLGL